MDLASSPFFAMLRTRLDQLSERQRLIAENIANASTPGYRPRDLDTAAFERMLSRSGAGGLTMAQTSPMHMGASGAVRAGAEIVTREGAETTIDGNAVVLEEEMARAAENRMNFEAGLALYQKGLQLVRMAARAPGR